MNESVIGILGGLGPSATCSLFQKVIHATSVEKDQDHFRVLIDSNPKIPDRTAAILYGGENPVPMMVQTAQNLERAGANILLIPCMTAHYFYDQLISGVHVSFVNAFDVLAAHLGQSYPSLHTVGVLCTSGSKAADLFGKKLPGYSIVYPEDGSQKEEVMEAVYGEQGIKRGNTGTYPRQLLKKAADKLVERGCELIVCGCTEVELALKQEDVSVPLIDPMQLMAERVTKRLAELNELEAPSSERQSIPHNRLTYTLPASS
ncbi:aspartate/glutamate racemase family protein [Atopococcus tabaci]|uniref:aspartate/glutamate racemase family protein n=1 Tax=Atopococcus tabaci TaxID=269774 RepID=UPI002409CB9E|nr:amino acid racemase [Atopococcus tabaci]